MAEHEPGGAAGARRSQLPIALALLLSAVAGCALSPQTVTINPTLQATPSAHGGGRTLGITVTDARGAETFGTRGGLYADTSDIVPDPNMLATIRAAVAGRMSGAGFTVQPPGGSGAIDMQVILRAVQYVASGEPTVRSIDIRATIEAVVTAGDRTYKGDSKVSQTHAVLKPPSAADNERFLNEIIALALDRILANPQFNQFFDE
jgi:uncharacterized lipoprotein